nr:MAG TPA_asm: hypothetical protein [Bacteriophage sp.]
MELLNVGGNADNRSQCGLSCANSNNGFSNSRTNIGARLNFYTKIKHSYQRNILNTVPWSQQIT